MTRRRYRKNPSTLTWLLLLAGGGVAVALYFWSRRAIVAPAMARGGLTAQLVGRPTATLQEMFPDVWTACQAALGVTAHKELLKECVVANSPEAAAIVAERKAAIVAEREEQRQRRTVGNYERY